MDFNKNKLPSSMREIDSYWRSHVRDKIDLAQVSIIGEVIDFKQPSDYFVLSDDTADKVSLIGKRFGFSSQPVSITDFELNIWEDIGEDTQIGVLLGRIKHFRDSADVYGLFAKFKYTGNSVYCAITICFVDKDVGEEMETAVFEISEDEEAYVLPVSISEESLDYYSLDDLAKLAYWLGNFWVGVQYELVNCPEEIHIVEQREYISSDQEDEYRHKKRIVLIRRVVLVDKDGNEIMRDSSSYGRKINQPVWGVRGHTRRLPDGRIVFVRPHRKGKDRENPDAVVSKEYRFVDEKIDKDVE